MINQWEEQANQSIANLPNLIYRIDACVYICIYSHTEAQNMDYTSCKLWMQTADQDKFSNFRKKSKNKSRAPSDHSVYNESFYTLTVQLLLPSITCWKVYISIELPEFYFPGQRNECCPQLDDYSYQFIKIKIKESIEQALLQAFCIDDFI